VALAARKVRPDGRRSVTVTLLAAVEPWLVTITV
jgi:hypothetical protein